MNRLTTGILIFNDIEVLDFCGPFEVFSATRLNQPRTREEPSPFDTFTVAESTAPITATGGLRVLPQHSMESCPPLDVLVVPGGWGTRREVDNSRMISWIGKQGNCAKLVTSVCTGSFLLAKAGLLTGKHATTHWASLDRMRTTFPDVIIENELHWVEDGNVLTSAGIAAGIDLALIVVAKIFGEAVARATARHMEYPFPDSRARRI